MSEYLMYLRKSRQDNPNESVEEVLNRHELQLQEYALKNFGYRIDESDIYREIVSGETIEDRPEINKVFQRMEHENIKGVLVIEPQRLTRGDLLDCGTVVHIFRYTSTLVVTPMKVYDISDKYDRKFFEMELTRGNDYLEYTKEILSRGRIASANEGNYIATFAPYGYDKVKIGKDVTLKINESESEYVKLIFKWYADGIGMNTIAHRLNELGAKPRMSDLFVTSTIGGILNNEVYIGKIRYQYRKTKPVYENGKIVKKRTREKDYILVDGKHEPIIDEETFYKAQAIRGRITREKSNTGLTNIYGGLLKCKKCGKAMTQTTYTRNGVVYRKPRYNCRTGKYCDNKSCNVDIVNNAVINALKATLNDFELKLNDDTKALYNSHENIIKQLEKELADLEIRQNELYDYLENKIYTTEVFLMRNEKLSVERERLKESINKARETAPTIKEYENKIISLHKVIDMLDDDTISTKQKNTFLKEIIDVIYYLKDDTGVSIDVHLK